MGDEKGNQSAEGANARAAVPPDAWERDGHKTGWGMLDAGKALQAVEQTGSF